jgi:hypothetical protein
MKNCIFFTVIAVVFLSCGLQSKLADSKSTPEEKWEVLKDYMAPDSVASSVRPMPNILSEQEILLKAADYANFIGALHPSHYFYDDNPELLTAKLETPILVHNFTGWDNGDGGMYLLNAVSKNGENLMSAYVRPVVDADSSSFELTSTVGRSRSPETSTHFMAKREVVDLIDSQFPNLPVSEPIAVQMKLDGDPYSHVAIFWYFTVEENNQRSVVGGEKEEYIIDAEIRKYGMISGGVSNRSAISINGGGSPHLGWERMAKLETPVHLLDRLQAARANGRSLAAVAAEPIPPVQFTPVSLK